MSEKDEDIWQAFERVLKEHPIQSDAEYYANFTIEQLDQTLESLVSKRRRLEDLLDSLSSQEDAVQDEFERRGISIILRLR